MIWIGFGFNISELNGYGLDLDLELSPSGTSAYMYLTQFNFINFIYEIKQTKSFTSINT